MVMSASRRTASAAFATMASPTSYKARRLASGQVVGAWDSGRACHKGSWRDDPDTETFTPTGSLDGARWGHTATRLTELRRWARLTEFPSQHTLEGAIRSADCGGEGIRWMAAPLADPVTLGEPR